MKIHMVKQGDTLYLIAKKYNVPLEELIKANPDISNPDAVDIGMKVKIPTHPKTMLGVIHQHVVQQGDTLWKLSKAWGVQLGDLVKANPQLKNPNALLTGEVVNIPQTGDPSGNAPGGGMTTGGMGMGKGMGMGGKANTAVMPATGGKANTAVQPAAEAPVPMPMPMPMPMPAPAPAPAVVQPIAEAPIYGLHVEQVEMIHTYQMPPMQAPVQAAQQTWPHEQPHYGYGIPEPLPGLGGETTMHPGYGYGHAHGYGHPQGVMPVAKAAQPHMGGLYTYHDISYSPPSPQQDEIPNGQTAGCANCGSQSVLPYYYVANPEGQSSADPYSGEGYYGDGRMPYGVPFVSPAAVSPYASAPGAQMPYAAAPYGGYPVMQQAPTFVSPMGDVPVGHAPIAEGLPKAGYGYGQGYGPQYGYGQPVPYGYDGLIPPIPPMPPMGPLPPLPGLPPLRDEGEDMRFAAGDDFPQDAQTQAAPARKRQHKPKAKVAPRQSKPKRKESLPWINW
ncbi:LysM peptidoglycan-binding domain-containing protein [Cohnella suwonensis]|uniref:LysM peptidoglycan-binding domain-containing protein n=1 Tax=Cohnella suwonensis TaxID=696072 RepID=A0ABW0LUR2_9BACL